MVKGQERRQFPRFDLACPLTICEPDGREVATTKTLNVSDGGLFAAVPVKTLPAHGTRVALTLRIPRSTPNTFMLEELEAAGQIIRQQPMKDHSMAGIALRFARPLTLQLDA